MLIKILKSIERAAGFSAPFMAAIRFVMNLLSGFGYFYFFLNHIIFSYGIYLSFMIESCDYPVSSSSAGSHVWSCIPECIVSKIFPNVMV